MTICEAPTRSVCLNCFFPLTSINRVLTERQQSLKIEDDDVRGVNIRQLTQRTHRIGNHRCLQLVSSSASLLFIFLFFPLSRTQGTRLLKLTRHTSGLFFSLYFFLSIFSSIFFSCQLEQPLGSLTQASQSLNVEP